jgi:hypothetical protein
MSLSGRDPIARDTGGQGANARFASLMDISKSRKENIPNAKYCLSVYDPHC